MSAQRPADYAQQLLDLLGPEEAEAFVLEEGLRHKGAFWAEVLAEIVSAETPSRFSWGNLVDWKAVEQQTGSHARGAHARMPPSEYADVEPKWVGPRHLWPAPPLARELWKGIRNFEAIELSGTASDPTPPGVPKESHRTFYLGTHRASWLDVDEGPRGRPLEDVPDELVTSWLAKVRVPLFLSRRQLEHRKKLPRAAARWALDSGGFSELTLHGEWKLGAREYVALVRRFRDEIGKLDWCAPLDWMCEAHMLERTGLSRVQHIERTVASYLELKSLAPDIPVIPVLQGHLSEDYYACAVLYDKNGVDLTKERVVGVGSVCRRQATVDRFGPAGTDLGFLAGLAGAGIRLHGFGFKKAGLVHAQRLFVSADSMAWSAEARHCDFACPEGKKKCNNCLHRALEWRSELLGKLGPAWQKDG